jgi:hypothetical protein
MKRYLETPEIMHSGSNDEPIRKKSCMDLITVDGCSAAADS